MKIRCVLVVAVFHCSVAFCSTLNCMFYKVGQANFVLLTHDSRALVVDCGVNDEYFAVFCKDTYKNDIREKLRNVNDIKTVVTHGHIDHKSRVKDLYKIIGDINTARKLMYGRECSEISVSELYYDSNARRSVVQEFLTGSLGDDVNVVAIAPEVVGGTLLDYDDVHQVNLVIVISYGDRSILLPGDANSALFSYHCLYTYGFCEMIRNCDIILLPHHGSWANGEQFWIDSVFHNDRSRLYIVSSDPYTKHYLPKLKYINRIINAGVRAESIEHDFRCADSYSERLHMKDVQDESGNWRVRIVSKNVQKTIVNVLLSADTTCNLFITASAKSPCYVVVVLQDSSFCLFDGNERLFPANC